MESQTITGQKTRRGFNLIESAIVLGVVGAIIGGIWVAAASLYESYKVNATLEIMTLGVKKIQSVLYRVPLGTYPDEYNLTDFGVAIEAIPTNKKTPYGDIRLYYDANYGGNIVKFQLKGLKTKSCVKLIMKIGNAQNNVYGISRIGVYPYGPSRTFTIFPIPMSEIEEKCTTIDSTGTVVFNFKYR